MTSRQPDRVGTRWWRVIGGLFITLLVLGAAALVRGVPPPPGVSAEEWEYCTEGNTFSGPVMVDYAGRRYLGWEGERDWERDGVGAAEIADEPGVGSACRIAFELYGLDQAEWKAAAKPGNVSVVPLAGRFGDSG